MKGIVPHVNALGYTAALAAYRDSRDWHQAMIDYLRENRDIVERAIEAMPGLSMHHVEATYLAWIDTRQTGMKDPVKIFEEAGVGLSDGRPFGAEGFCAVELRLPPSPVGGSLTENAEGYGNIAALSHFLVSFRP